MNINLLKGISFITKFKLFIGSEFTHSVFIRGLAKGIATLTIILLTLTQMESLTYDNFIQMENISYLGMGLACFLGYNKVQKKIGQSLHVKNNFVDLAIIFGVLIFFTKFYYSLIYYIVDKFFQYSTSLYTEKNYGMEK